MTREQAQAILKTLTRDQKKYLYEYLSELEKARKCRKRRCIIAFVFDRRRSRKQSGLHNEHP